MSIICVLAIPMPNLSSCQSTTWQQQSSLSSKLGQYWRLLREVLQMLEHYLATKRFPTWAEQYAQAVAATYQPDCIILFGSVARSTHTPHSDIDVIVIGGDLPSSARERFLRLIRLRPRFAPIQVQSFTRAEWDRMLAAKHVTVLEALKDGQPLHGRALFRQWRREFEHWQSLGLQRNEASWHVPKTLQHQT